MAYKNGSAGRNYKQEYKTSQSSPQDIKDREARNKARRMLEAEGKVHKGDGLDVAHIKAIDRGGKTVRSNLEAETVHKNRAYKRKSDGSPVK